MFSSPIRTAKNPSLKKVVGDGTGLGQKRLEITARELLVAC
jgi:hypothetical protein